MLELDLPYPPSINHYYRKAGGKIIISRNGQKYRKRICDILAAMGSPRFEGLLKMDIEAYPPDNRVRDVDNVQKALLDALEHGKLYSNDSTIKKLTSEMMDKVKGGRLIVRIGRYERQ